jgi:hypothetical protein
MLVAGINEAIKLNRITLDPDNWPDESIFDFTIAGLPARGSVYGISHGEVSISVVVNPKRTNLSPGGYVGGHSLTHLGDAHAMGWLERRDGAWLQYYKPPLIKIRNHLKPIIAGASIKPRGFADMGRFYL